MSLEEVMNSRGAERFAKIAEFLKTRPNPASIEPTITEQLAFEVSRIHRAGVNSPSYNLFTPEIMRTMLSMCAYNIAALQGESAPNYHVLASLNEAAGKLSVRLARPQQNWTIKQTEYRQAFQYFENAAKYYKITENTKQRAFTHKFKADAFFEFAEWLKSPEKRREIYARASASHLKSAELFRKEAHPITAAEYSYAGKSEYIVAKLSHYRPKKEQEQAARKAALYALQALRFNKEDLHKPHLTFDVAKSSDALQQITREEGHRDRTKRYYEKAADFFRKEANSQNIIAQCERRISELSASTLQAHP